MIPLSASAVAPRRRAPLLLLVVAGLVAVAIAATIGWASLSTARAFELPFAPDAENGHLAESASLADEQHPAIGRLDPALLEAMRAAEAEAGHEGIAFAITSGWRSAALQQWLFDEAVRTYGSVDVARQFVASPERSHHVTGTAVDVGNLDAQLWLMEHGAAWGICQIYANERWHFELATTPGGTCPDLLPDAAG